MIIYKVTNNINGKIYIGQTINSLESRWKAHIITAYKHNYSFPNAIKKYGKDNFKIEQIDSASSREELNNLEQYWIILLDSVNPIIGYNLTTGGNNNSVYSEESKLKMSLAKKGKPSKKVDCSCSPETAKKISNSNKGKKAWNKGIPRTEEQKKHFSDVMKGRPVWNKGKKLNNKEIIAINLTTNEEFLFSSIHEVVEKLNVGRCAVQNVLSGRAKRTKNNFTYKYKGDI